MHTKKAKPCARTLYTGIAQLVEHWSPKPGVGSSSLSSRAKIEKSMNLIKYCKDSYEELAHKTTWPTAKELTNSALIVLTASVIIALVVFGMDKLFQFVMTTVYPG